MAMKRTRAQLKMPTWLLRDVVIVLVVCCLGVPAVAGEETEPPAEEAEEWYFQVLRFAAIAGLVALSGLFSGLTLGLLGLDLSELNIVIGGSPGSKDAKNASTILPIRSQGNLLLCTLLLGNVAVNALLSILLADLTNGLVGFLASTGIIVIAGEIVPQAVCSRYALAIGAKAVPLVRIIMYLLYILAKPISMVLDFALGAEMGTTYTKGQITELLKMQVRADIISDLQSTVMSGALKLKEEVGAIMTKMEDVVCIQADVELDFSTLSKVFQSGYSRIPVLAPGSMDIIGIMYAKDLIVLDPGDRITVRRVIEFFHRDRFLLKVWHDEELQSVLQKMKKAKTHIALVQDVNTAGQGDPTYEVVGVVTMEDIIEVILQGGIEDEYDHNAGSEDGSESGEDAITRRTTFDYAHLRLLDSSKGVNDLNDTEVNVVSAHLLANCSAFKTLNTEGNTLTMDEMKTLVRQCRVMELQNPNKANSKHNKRTQMMLGKMEVGSGRRQVPAVVDGRLTPADHKAEESKTEAAQMAEDAALGMVYKRGRVDTFCTLVLSGTLEIHAGADGFRAEAHRFEIIAASALTLPAGSYVPDFSAYIKSDVVRCLRISHAQFQTALGHPPPVPLNRKRASSTQSATHRPSIVQAGAGAGAGAAADDVAINIAPSADTAASGSKAAAAAGVGNGRAPRARSGSTQVRRYAALIGGSPDTPEHAGAEKPATGVNVEAEVIGSGAANRDRAAAAQMSALIAAAVDASVHHPNGDGAAADAPAAAPSESDAKASATVAAGEGDAAAPSASGSDDAATNGSS